MDLNGLEATLIAGAIATVSAWISSTVQAYRYQTKTGCDERHKSVCKESADLKEDIEKKEDQRRDDVNLIMRMLREIIVHLPIPEQHKANILNDRGGK